MKVRVECAWEICSIVLQTKKTDQDLTILEAKALRAELDSAITRYEELDQLVEEHDNKTLNSS